MQLLCLSLKIIWACSGLSPVRARPCTPTPTLREPENGAYIYGYTHYLLFQSLHSRKQMIFDTLLEHDIEVFYWGNYN